MENQYKQINEYNRQNYDHVNIMLPKGKKNHIKQMASENGESVNGFVNRLLQTALNMTEEEWKAKAV